MEQQFVIETKEIAKRHIENGMIDELKYLMKLQEQAKDHNHKCKIIYDIYSCELKKLGI